MISIPGRGRQCCRPSGTPERGTAGASSELATSATSRRPGGATPQASWSPDPHRSRHGRDDQAQAVTQRSVRNYLNFAERIVVLAPATWSGVPARAWQPAAVRGDARVPLLSRDSRTRRAARRADRTGGRGGGRDSCDGMYRCAAAGCATKASAGTNGCRLLPVLAGTLPQPLIGARPAAVTGDARWGKRSGWDRGGGAARRRGGGAARRRGGGARQKGRRRRVFAACDPVLVVDVPRHPEEARNVGGVW